MNPAWRFYKGNCVGAEAVNFNDRSWEVVSLPHGIEYLPTEASGCINYQGEVWYRKHFTPPAKIEHLAEMASDIVSLGNQTGEGWFLTGEMLELIENGAQNIICAQPFACLPNHVVGKGVIKELRRLHPQSNIVAIDFDPGASEVNQLNRIKLMLSTAFKNMEKENQSM